MPSHTVDKYSLDENDTSESDRCMTTPGPGAPEPGLRLAAAGPGASRGGGQGTFGYGVGMASSETASEDEDKDMTSPDNSGGDERGDINMTSSNATEETGNEQHEGHAGSVAGSVVIETDSDDEDIEIDENGVCTRGKEHTPIVGTLNNGSTEHMPSGMGHGLQGTRKKRCSILIELSESLASEVRVGYVNCGPVMYWDRDRRFCLKIDIYL